MENNIEERLRFLEKQMSKLSNEVPLTPKDNEYLQLMKKVHENFTQNKEKIISSHPDLQSYECNRDEQNVIYLKSDLLNDISKFRKFLKLI